MAAFVYGEHFTASHFKARDLAIEAYNPPSKRSRRIRQFTSAMTSILTR